MLPTARLQLSRPCIERPESTAPLPRPMLPLVTRLLLSRPCVERPAAGGPAVTRVHAQWQHQVWTLSADDERLWWGVMAVTRVHTQWQHQVWTMTVDDERLGGGGRRLMICRVGGGEGRRGVPGPREGGGEGGGSMRALG